MYMWCSIDAASGTIPGMSKTVERALLEIHEKAGMLRVYSDAMSATSLPEDPVLFSGLGTVLGEIERLSRRVQRALNAETLDTPLTAPKRRSG